ncbi:MAG: glutamine--fructose-6-phosphate transaminase (isomerizing) [Labilithrix sp.]|nr:glutamine--fructose-6-phosphate transaminase (isomerizing) [Labilithrix sp.]
MCGIVAYVGNENCASILVEGLSRLEYRGYDSAGLAIHTGGGVEIVRTVGKLARLAEALERAPLRGKTGIGHTRWATHGKPSAENAHPHTSGPVAVVHNGIIENYAALRRELSARGRRFTSETDTEVIAHLVAEALERDPGAALEAAVRTALSHVEGAYAVAVTSRFEPHRIVVAKRDSPLVIGLSDEATFAASDVPAILGRVKRVVFLEDGDVATLTAAGASITTLSGEAVVRAPRAVDWSLEQAEKGGFAHFMEKEIHEQPRAIEATIGGRFAPGASDVNLDDAGLAPEEVANIRRVYFVACGTSAHAAMVGRYWIEQLAKIPAVVEIASEVRYREPVLGPTDLVVAVSQSGETADTLAAVKTAKAMGAKVLSIANVLGSAIPRASDATLYTNAGPEIGVASTKCFTTQLVALLMLSVWLGRRREVLDEARAAEILAALRKTPAQVRELVGLSSSTRAVAEQFSAARDILFLGRGTQFPVALEGALKLKEISYVHAEGYAAGEMKHGPIALIDAAVPVVVLCPRDRNRDKTLSNLNEVRAREGRVVALATAGDADVASAAEVALPLPEADETVLPILTTIPLQLLAYHFALVRGHDVDQPRNLAKTVTVE